MNASHAIDAANLEALVASGTVTVWVPTAELKDRYNAIGGKIEAHFDGADEYATEHDFDVDWYAYKALGQQIRERAAGTF